MKTAILGAGAMGSVFASYLAESKDEVVLIDIAEPVVDSISSRGLIIRDKAGNEKTFRIAATAEPSNVGAVDLLIVFVKCYHTEAAVRSALPLLGDNSIVLSLQNGWGNASATLPKGPTLLFAKTLVISERPSAPRRRMRTPAKRWDTPAHRLPHRDRRNS